MEFPLSDIVSLNVVLYVRNPHMGLLLTEVCAVAVGVQGDSRVYRYICILRAVTSLDMMSAEPYEFSWSLLKAISRRVINEVNGVARVVYDTTSKPPGKTTPLFSS
jgi:GMP synthase PP-ATPase subunit